MPKIVVNIDDLTLDDVETMSEEAASKADSLEVARAILPYFMVGDDGERLSLDEARAVVGKIRVGDLRRAMVEIQRATAELWDEAVPPEGAGS